MEYGVEHHGMRSNNVTYQVQSLEQVPAETAFGALAR